MAGRGAAGMVKHSASIKLKGLSFAWPPVVATMIKGLQHIPLHVARKVTGYFVLAALILFTLTPVIIWTEPNQLRMFFNGITSTASPGFPVPSVHQETPKIQNV